MLNVRFRSPWPLPARDGSRPGVAFRASRAVPALAAAAVLLATGALAQTANWWDGPRSFPPDYVPRDNNPAGAARKDDVNDLRPGKVPWRSDEMLIAIERAIGQYQQIASRGGWPQIPGNKMLRVGDDDERVPALRRRLYATGDLRGGSGYDDYVFDTNVENAVVRYQERNGLRASGRVDRPTLAALNITADERLSQLKLNYDRILELTRMPPEDRYVLVNVPAFQLEAVERYEVARRHRVIAGRIGRETPSLRATIKGMNFFPYWRVPDSVAQLDIIPRLQKEPEYLEHEGIRVIAGDFNGHELDPSLIDWTTASAKTIKFRQEPGPKNALGLLRIDMANEHGVYMHDTPMKQLFEQRARAFSAGCVRVQDVFKLGDWLAQYEPGWEQPGRVESVLEQGQALDLTLTRPVPVYFTYITAWAEADGLVQFRPDIYKRDGFAAVAEFQDPDAPPPPQSGLAP